MPRWWWICWTGLFREKSQWKHWISVRLKRSKFQLQFILRNRQNFRIWFALSFWGLFVSLRSFRWNTATGAETDGWGGQGSNAGNLCAVRTLTTSMPMCWHLHCSRKFHRRHQEMWKLTNFWPFCGFMQIDANPISVVSQCNAGSIDFFMLTLASTYRVRWTEEVKNTLKRISWRKSSNKFRHLPKLQPTQLELPIWQCWNLRNRGDDPMPWQLAATPTTWFSLSSTEGTVPPRSFSRKFAWKSWRFL